MAYFYFNDVAAGATGTLPNRVFEELTGVTVALPLVAALVLLERRVPLDRARWRQVACDLIVAARSALGPHTQRASYPGDGSAETEVGGDALENLGGLVRPLLM